MHLIDHRKAAVRNIPLHQSQEHLAVDVHAYQLAKPERWEVVALHPQEQPTGA